METLLKLEAISMPHSTERRNVLYENRTKDYARFIHYTSADAALKIIKSKRVWMRNTTCMSDYREVQHGYDVLNKVFSTNGNLGRFQSALDAFVPGAAKEAINLFDGWWRDIRFSTYITSISEHDDTEDTHGRLSMWRGFGGGNVARVALVLQLPITAVGATEELKIMVSPVAYLQETDVQNELNAVIENVGNSAGFIQSVDRQASRQLRLRHAHGGCCVHEACGLSRRAGMADRLRTETHAFSFHGIIDRDHRGCSSGDSQNSARRPRLSPISTLLVYSTA
jgi:hypothetical protein